MGSTERPRKEKRHLGLRCEAMIVLGFIWMILGLGVLELASTTPSGLFFQMVPAELRGIAWTVTGLYAIVTGIRSKHTSRAVAGLMIMPLFRLLNYLAGWVLYLIPGNQVAEVPDGWFVAALYAAMCSFVYLVAHIPPGLMRTLSSPDLEKMHRRMEAGGTSHEGTAHRYEGGAHP